MYDGILAEIVFDVSKFHHVDRPIERKRLCHFFGKAEQIYFNFKIGRPGKMYITQIRIRTKIFIFPLKPMSSNFIKKLYIVLYLSFRLHRRKIHGSCKTIETRNMY